MLDTNTKGSLGRYINANNLPAIVEHLHQFGWYSITSYLPGIVETGNSEVLELITNTGGINIDKTTLSIIAVVNKQPECLGLLLSVGDKVIANGNALLMTAIINDDVDSVGLLVGYDVNILEHGMDRVLELLDNSSYLVRRTMVEPLIKAMFNRNKRLNLFKYGDTVDAELSLYNKISTLLYGVLFTKTELAALELTPDDLELILTSELETTTHTKYQLPNSSVCCPCGDCHKDDDNKEDTTEECECPDMILMYTALSGDLLVTTKRSTSVELDPQQQFLAGCKSNDTAVIAELISVVDNATRLLGTQHATASDNLDAVKLLCNHNSVMDMAYITACEYGCVDIVDWLLSVGYIPTNSRGIYTAIANGYGKLVSVLVNAGMRL